jgi:hypothetical protein
MCNLFIQIYNEKTSAIQSENVNLVFTTNTSNVISKCLPTFCNDTVLEVQNKGV